MYGVLSPGSLPLGPLEAFRQTLREVGYIDGQNITIEWRFAEGKNDRLPQLAEDLVRLKVDVIFVINTQAAQAAKKVAGTIPIVFARVSDPTRTGLVASLSRPGGNITGLSNVADELGGKRLELLKETLPPRLASCGALEFWKSRRGTYREGDGVCQSSAKRAASQRGDARAQGLSQRL